ncbi:MAG: DUF4097 domain-containing protein [Acidobacteria bacterium]|nr:DUF4097 domain-containing protein [Acidobacteriota bacterium]
MSKGYRPSLLGGLIWLGLGVLLLLHNFRIGPDIWTLLGRYWPVLLILLGLGKILDYFLNRDFSIRVGEVVGILVFLLVGLALTAVSESHVGAMIRELPIPIGGTLTRPGSWLGDSHTYVEERTFPLESRRIKVENSHGGVAIIPGNDKELRVRLRKTIYGSEERVRNFAAQLRLSGELSAGGQFLVRTNRESLSTPVRMFKTDMELFVPRESQVQVVNSFGDLTVRNIHGKLDLTTTHGQLDVRACSGDFTVSNRYGESRLINLSGSLALDARGRAYIKDIRGDVTVRNEYSPVEIFDVDGKTDLSVTEGSVRAENIMKPLSVVARGSHVRLNNIRDSVKAVISHRDADISNTDADVKIESSYATLRIRNIKGNLDINSGFDRVFASDISGGVKLAGKGSAVRANSIKGPLDVQTTFKDVFVDGFESSCFVTNQHAGINISSQSVGKGDIDVTNNNGSVTLFLPDDAAFSISASAQNGAIHSGYPGLEPVRKGGDAMLKSTVNSGGSAITVQTRYGNINIYRMRDRRNDRSKF